MSFERRSVAQLDETVLKRLLSADREAMIAILNNWLRLGDNQQDVVAFAKLAKAVRMHYLLQNGKSSSPVPTSTVCSNMKPQMPSTGAMTATRNDLGRYKTELCRPFEETGSCKYGSKCQFAHGAVELRPLPRHPKYKTELCRTFHTSGFCPYGPRCHFVHHENDGALKMKVGSVDSQVASSVCCRYEAVTSNEGAAVP